MKVPALLIVFFLTISVRAPPPPSAEMMAAIAETSSALARSAVSLERLALSDAQTLRSALQSRKEISFRELEAIITGHKDDAAIVKMASERLSQDLSFSELNRIYQMEMSDLAHREFILSYFRSHPQHFEQVINSIDGNRIPFSDINVILSSMEKVSEETFFNLLNRKTATSSDVIARLNALDLAITKMEHPTLYSVRLLRALQILGSQGGDEITALELYEQRILDKIEKTSGPVSIEEPFPKHKSAIRIFMNRKSVDQVRTSLQVLKSSFDANPYLTSAQFIEILEKYPTHVGIISDMAGWKILNDGPVLTALTETQRRLQQSGELDAGTELAGIYKKLRNQLKSPASHSNDLPDTGFRWHRASSNTARPVTESVSTLEETPSTSNVVRGPSLPQSPFAKAPPPAWSASDRVSKT